MGVFSKNEKIAAKKASFLLSSDTLSGYGLDMIFQIAREINFDGIDLCLRKNFDAWNVGYLSQLVEKYQMPIKVIQVSDKVNLKEMNYAVEAAKELGVNSITINSPYLLDNKVYKFISNNLKAYKKQNPKIKFSIINPPKSSFFMLPLQKYYFSNIVEIIKKYGAYLGCDISNFDESILEIGFLKKISNFIPHLDVIYLSDKTKVGKGHVPLGEGSLKLRSILKKFKQNEYYNHISLKINITKKDLLDLEKIEQILKKCRLFYKENFEDLVIK